MTGCQQQECPLSVENDTPKVQERISSFLELPAEIRNDIYSCLLADVQGQVKMRYRRNGRASIKWNAYARAMISLSATCRQLHAETALLPFTAAEFQYSFYTSTWFQKLAKHQRISVRNIRSYIIPRLPADFDHPARLMVDGEAGEGLAWLEDVTKQLKEVLPGLETWQIDRVSSRLRRDLIVRDDLVINGVLVKISARCG